MFLGFNTIANYGLSVLRQVNVVNFTVPQAIYTQEGTLLIPACSKVVATIIRIEKQRMPNKNARVYLNFECLILPDGTAIAMSAKPLTKDSSLKEDGWHTAGKLTAYTLGLGIVGAGAGTGFAFIPNPAKLGVGYSNRYTCWYNSGLDNRTYYTRVEIPRKSW